MKHISFILLFVSFFTVSHIQAETTFACDTIELNKDTILVIETACAPICSSIVNVYSNNWQYIGRLMPPIANCVFPEAYVENKRLRWRDNTPLMLDEEEKKHQQAGTINQQQDEKH